MADILEYITWRGDLDFELVPLNEVDALILCQLSYLDFGGIVGDGFSAGVTVREAADRFFAAEDSSRRSDVGALINFKTVELLKAAGKSVRFGSLLMCGYVAQTDEVEELQFAAVTFVCGKLRRPRWSFVAYRGTDDTIVGWKEDFNLGYKDTVPAQRSAAAYLAGAARNLKGALYAGGHSKGGNLALFAAACAEKGVQRRLLSVFNNDGPGFSDSFFAGAGYRAVEDRVQTFVPRLSVVGMLFSHPEHFTTVVSGEKNMLMQHDPFSWFVRANGFEECSGLGERSRFVGKTVNEWFSDLSKEEKELFIETVFGVLKDTEAKTNSELAANWSNSAVKMVKSASQLNPKTREAVTKTVQLLIKIMVDELRHGNAPEA